MVDWGAVVIVSFLISSMFDVSRCTNRLSENNSVWITLDRKAALKIIRSKAIITSFTSAVPTSIPPSRAEAFKPKYDIIHQSSPTTLPSSLKPNSIVLENNVTDTYDNNSELIIINVSELALYNVSVFVHQHFHRCGGFVAHESFQEARHYIKMYKERSRNLKKVSYIINNWYTVNKLKSAVNSNSIQKTVNTLMTTFHNRYFDSDIGIKVSHWIKNLWKRISWYRKDITIEYFDHSPKYKQASVVATIKGSDQSNEIVIIGAHLDSIIGMSHHMDPWAKSPGADDNGSGIAVITETLQAIVKLGFAPMKTIKIIAFAAEEVGLRGSMAIAKNYKSRGYNVLGMLNLDMVGYKGNDEDIFIYNDDDTDKWQNEFLALLVKKHLPDLSIGYSRCQSICSDHHSWHIHGFPASYVAESEFLRPAPNYHTEKDTDVNKEHMIKFAKLAAIYLAELAKIYPNSFIEKKTTSSTRMKISSKTQKYEKSITRMKISYTAKQTQFSTDSNEHLKVSSTSALKINLSNICIAFLSICYFILRADN